MPKVPLQPHTNGTDSEPGPLFQTFAFHSGLEGGSDTGRKHFPKTSALSAPSSCWAFTLLALCPPVLRSSPHAFPTKSKPSKAQRRRRPFSHISPYKVGVVGIWGAPAGPLVLPEAVGGRGFPSHRVTSRHVTSRHVTSRHVTSRRVASRRIASHHITSHHVTSHRIASHRITSHRITSPQGRSRCLPDAR